MSATTTWKIPLPGNSPRNSGNSGIIKELEQKLKGRQGAADMSKVSPVISDDRRNSKGTLSEKQTINENMLQARARWAAQTKEKEEAAEAGSEEEPSEEKKEFALSLDGASRFRIDADDGGEDETVNLRSKRAYSTSTGKNQRIIPAPPKSRPPVLEAQSLSGGADRPISPRDNLVRPQQVQRGGLQGEKQMKQVTNTGLKNAAMKKLKKLVKGNKNRSAGNIVKSSSPGTAPGRKIGLKKALSENILIHKQITPQEFAEDSSVPNSIFARDYQNVFDDVAFTEGRRSNTDSPTDFNNRKPKPLPRRGYTGNLRNSLGSNDSDMETPPPQSLSPLVTSPTNTVTPTSAKSDSSAFSSSHLATNELRSPDEYFKAEEFLSSGEILEEGESTEEDEDLVPYFPQGALSKKPLGKATSFNPVREEDWGAPVARKSTTRQKKMRRAVFSDGDQEEVHDDYIMMNSVCLSEYSPAENVRSLGRAKVLSVVAEAPPGSTNLCTKKESHAIKLPVNSKNSLCSSPRSPGLTIPTCQQRTFGGSSGSSVGFGVPRDEKRSSAYYLKIVSSQHSSPAQPSEIGKRSDNAEKEAEEGVEFYGEVTRLSEPAKRKQSKEDAVPFKNMATIADFTPQLLSSVQDQSRNKRAATPPKTQDVYSGKTTTESSPHQREKKIQYTPVTIEAGVKRKTSGGPKTSKNETVVPGKESSKTAIPKTRDSDAADVRRKTSASKLAQEALERRSRSPETPLAPAKKAHPLLNLTAGSVSTMHQSQRSYYINRKSLIEQESCKDLPTTMLKTVDAVTGKVVWHEYVEIDEEQINTMANKFGMATSAPIPEKLGMLLGVSKLNDQAPPSAPVATTTSKVEAAANTESNTKGECAKSAESDDSESENDGSNSLNSSMSSECNYVFNLNDPPNVPPRPDNLDALVGQLEDRASGDYSYAFFPGTQFFGKHWMMTKARSASKPSLLASNAFSSPAQENQKDKTLEVTGQRKISAPALSLAKTVKKLDSKLPPPSLPPRSHSLLREQELAAPRPTPPEPYLLPIIVRTKATKKQAKESNTSPSFVSYIRDQSIPGSSRTRKSSPPKPLPYLQHRKMKQQKKLQEVCPVPSSPHITEPQGSNYMAVGMRYQDTVRRKNGVGRPLGNRSRARTKAHKKLARQKSHRGSGGKTAGVSQRRRNARPEGVRRKTSGGVHKRKKPRGPRPELTDQLKRESLARFIESEGALAEKIRTSVRRMEQEGSTDEETAKSAASAAVDDDDLGEVLVRLGNLIKSKQCSETDLLALITNHFKLKLKDEAVTNSVPDGEKDSPDEKDGTLDNTDNQEAGSISCKQGRPYVNLVFSDNEGASVTNEGGAKEDQSEGSSNEASKATQSEVSKERKPSYVNLLFSDDDKAGKLEETTDYKPGYINMEYLTGKTAAAVLLNQESSDDEFDYVEPSEAIGDRRLMLAVESTMSGARNISVMHSANDDSSGDVCLLNTQITTPPGMGTVKSLRKHSMSPVMSTSQEQQQLPVLPLCHERTLSTPQDPDDLNTTANEPKEESNLDFRSSPLIRREQEFPPNLLRARKSIDVTNGATENTSSYNLALEMEDIRFSRSLDEGTALKTKLSKLIEEEGEEGEEGKSKLISVLGIMYMRIGTSCTAVCHTNTLCIPLTTLPGLLIGGNLTLIQ